MSTRPKLRDGATVIKLSRRMVEVRTQIAEGLTVSMRFSTEEQLRKLCQASGHAGAELYLYLFQEVSDYAKVGKHELQGFDGLPALWALENLSDTVDELSA